MTSVNVEEYMKREITQVEINARVARRKQWCKDLDKANAKSPLPDDFIDYCKGRKFRQAVAL
jgi:hypothetical protein